MHARNRQTKYSCYMGTPETNLQTPISICRSRCPHSQGYNDNSGLGPILAKYLEDESDQGQILALVINQLGDHQMETYFRSTEESNGGMICEGEASMDDVFDKMKDIHHESFQELGGEYVRRGNETTCAIRLPPNTFFEVAFRNTFRGSAGEVERVADG